jgi:predicted outer membrane protein
MERAKLALSITATALGVAACSGAQTQSPPPQDPTSVTMTTNAEVPVSPPIAPLPPGSTNPSYGDIWGSEPPPAVAPAPVTADQAAPPPTPTTGTPTVHTAPALTDAEIAGVIDAAALSQRQEAREAAKRTNDPRVQQFAQRVLADDAHAETRLERAESTSSISSRDSATSAELRSTTTRTLDTLRTASPSELDKLYIDAQVGENRRLLELLEGTLLPATQSADLKTFLREWRASTSRHLSAAEEIQSSLAK